MSVMEGSKGQQKGEIDPVSDPMEVGEHEVHGSSTTFTDSDPPMADQSLLAALQASAKWEQDWKPIIEDLMKQTGVKTIDKLRGLDGETLNELLQMVKLLPLRSELRSLKGLMDIDQEVTFTVNGGIKSAAHYFYVTPKNTQLINAVKQRKYIMFQGHRGSGKTTSIFALARSISTKCPVVYVSLQGGVSFESIDRFWETFGYKLSREMRHLGLSNQEMFRLCDILDVIANLQRPICLCIDEFDAVLGHQAVMDELMGVLRDMKFRRDKGDLYSFLWSVVIVGPLSILTAGSLTVSTSPFNVTDSISCPYFTEDETAHLFEQFNQHTFKGSYRISDRIINDIYERTQGHPGYTCFCGKTIAERMIRGKATLSYADWLVEAVFHLASNITSNWATSGKLQQVVLQERYSSFLWQHFIYSADTTITFTNVNDQRIARELTAEGALAVVRDEGDFSWSTFKVPSQLVADIIISTLIPVHQSQLPPNTILNCSRLNVPELLSAMILRFNAKALRDACDYSHKSDEAGGAGYVPREGVYELEMLPLLRAWLSPQAGWLVAPQNQVNGKRRDILVKSTEEMWVFELVAHSRNGPKDRPGTVMEHFVRAHEQYKDSPETEVWVINFTVSEGNFVWAKDVGLCDKDVRVVHVQHDKEWTFAHLFFDDGREELLELV